MRTCFPKLVQNLEVNIIKTIKKVDRKIISHIFYSNLIWGNKFRLDQWKCMTLSTIHKAQEVLFSSSGNVHSTPLNDKSQEVLELVSPITLWILWKQRCRRVFSNQIAHPTRLLQEIWSETVATLKSQYDGLKGDSDGVERQRIAFIQQWSSSPFLESVGIHIRWNHCIPTGICT